MDGGREEVEAALADWSLTLDAEVGRSSSSGVELAQAAVEQDADAVVIELGTNDTSSSVFRAHLIETLDTVAGSPSDLADGQGARGRPEHPRGQCGDPRGRADLPERLDRRLDRLRTRRGGADRRNPPRRRLPGSRGRTPRADPFGMAGRAAPEGSDHLWPGHRARDILTGLGDERAGGAGIRRLVCIVLGLPDLTWPGDLSMPPAARLARGFCSPRSYLSIALRPYTRLVMLRNGGGQEPDAAGCSRRSARRSARSAASRGIPDETARAISRSSRSIVGAILPGRRWTTISSLPTADSRRRITTSPGFWRSRYSASETISPMGPS